MKAHFFMLAILGSLFVNAYSQQAGYRLMTFNIRFDNPADGINSWNHRKKLVKNTLKAEHPDVIGLQEVLDRQLGYLDKHLKDYTSLGVGRDDGQLSGEFSPLLYLKDRFEMINWGTFWLSETPDDTGSVGWDAALPRICTWAVLKDVRLDQEFFILNTHFDHIGQDARTESARLIVDFIQKHASGRPVILTGDFNCTPSEDPYSILTNRENGLQDACVEARGAEGCTEGTFNGFGSTKNNGRIDLILLKGPWKVHSIQILKIKRENMFISDHYPVEAEVELEIEN